MEARIQVDNPQKKNLHFVGIMVLYLLGIFMGAIDTSVVTPARVVIENGLGVNEQTGIWMITVYTLAYAASIPVMGKLADLKGRKKIYLLCIILFGGGSLIAGLSQYFGNFYLFLGARAIQAIGGGGIMPIATAEFGTTFPEEKRGLALGLVGGAYGIATVIGGSLGSLILGIFGTANWGYIFFINVPVSLIVIIGGLFILPDTKAEDVKKIDLWGILVLVIMIFSLLYGLRNIDFFNFGKSLISADVYPFILVFLGALPIFMILEKKAADPIMHMDYFKNRDIVMTLIISFITGSVMMGMIFVPQFAENTLRMQAGSGGYFVMIIGLFAGVGAPVSGKLIDKFGAKPIMGGGLILSIIGSLFVIFVTAKFQNIYTVIIALIIIGLGMGFTMGTPLNYMMLNHTKKEEANSALATLSLFRSIGTSIAPAIMIGFIAQAGMTAQTNITNIFPKVLELPTLPFAESIDKEVAELRTDPNMMTIFKSVPELDYVGLSSVDLSSGKTNGKESFPPEITKKLKDADVTNIVETVNQMAAYIAEKMKPGIQGEISGKVAENMKDMKDVSENPGFPMTYLGEMGLIFGQIGALEEGIPSAVDQGITKYKDQIKNKDADIEATFENSMEKGYQNVYTVTAVMSVLGLIALVFYRDIKK